MFKDSAHPPRGKPPTDNMMIRGNQIKPPRGGAQNLAPMEQRMSKNKNIIHSLSDAIGRGGHR
jgi:hypothetical protein